MENPNCIFFQFQQSSDGSSRRGEIARIKESGLQNFPKRYSIVFDDLQDFVRNRTEALEACSFWKAPLIIPMLQYGARSFRDFDAHHSELLRRGIRLIVLRFGRKFLDSFNQSNLTLSDYALAFAEFESDLARERTFKATNASRGAINTGKPPIKDEIKYAIVKAHASGLSSAGQLAKQHSIGLSTVYRIVKEAREED